MFPLTIDPTGHLPFTISDEQLVAAVRADVRGAADAIHARYSAALLGYARALLGGAHHDAEECVQDAFVRALRALKADPDREIALKGWLYTIVRNACLDLLRRPSRSIGLDEFGSTLSDGRADPHATLMRRESLTDIVVGLRALPARQRAALVGHELEGRSHAELATVLGVSEGASKALLHRARAGLQATLAA